MFKIEYTKYFERNYKKLTKNNSSIKTKIDKVVRILRNDPFDKKIRTHRVGADKIHGDLWSSRVTGDIRLIWIFDSERENIIILVKVGEHDEVY